MYVNTRPFHHTHKSSIEATSDTMAFIHPTPHPLARQIIELVDGRSFQVDDWWDRVMQTSTSWYLSDVRRNFALAAFALEQAKTNLPMDDDIVYGKIGDFGVIIHVRQFARG